MHRRLAIITWVTFTHVTRGIFRPPDPTPQLSDNDNEEEEEMEKDNEEGGLTSGSRWGCGQEPPLVPGSPPGFPSGSWLRLGVEKFSVNFHAISRIFT